MTTTEKLRAAKRRPTPKPIMHRASLECPDCGKTWPTLHPFRYRRHWRLTHSAPPVGVRDAKEPA